MKYKLKPVIVEAKQLEDGISSRQDIADWCDGDYHIHHNEVLVPCDHDNVYAVVGDFIIKRYDGSFIVLNETDFMNVYEPFDV